MINALTLFGLVSLSFALMCDAFEERSPWFSFGFAVGCIGGSIYGFLQGAWPFGVVEAIWFFVKMNYWWKRRKISKENDVSE
jgi:hypothetical protein